MSEFSVILVNYNSGKLLQNALDSLAEQSFRDFEVIVVDNASDDGSPSDLDVANIPGFRLLKLTENVGFAKANNLAADMASGTWLALLNPDAYAKSDWLETIHNSFQQYPGISVFASKQISLDNDTILDGTGDAYLAFGFPWRGGFGHSISKLPAAGLTFGPCGASAVYRADLFRTAGGFDEDFFCYCEDVDLAFRLRLMGEACIFLPEASVKHAGSAITGPKSNFTLYHGTRNRIWLYFKNMPNTLLLLTLPGHVIISAYLIVRSYMTGRGEITLRGMRDGYLKALAKRRLSKDLRSSRKATLAHLASIMVWNPFKMSQHRPDIRPLKTT